MKGIKLKISDLKLLNLEEIEISNPDCLNDKNWKILKQFRKKTSNPGEKVVYVYYLLVECIKCGAQKLIAKAGAKRQLIKCENCLRQSYVGNIYGPYKVLAYDHSEKVFTNRTYTYHYYKVECIHCGKQFLKILNTAQWKKYNRCSKCNSISNDFFVNSMYSAYKESAKNRKIEFNLSGEDFQKLINLNCIYCGQEPEERNYKTYDKSGNEKEPYTGKVNGIDRIDSSKGYEIDNCVPCCKKCNIMKGTLSYRDFKQQISKIYNYSIVNKKEGDSININLKATQLI